MTEEEVEFWFDSEEERRLFYVAITRARHELDILQVDKYHDHYHKPSRFIGDLYKADANVEVVRLSYRQELHASP